MTTSAIEPPTRRPFAGIASLELEITGGCPRWCAHCRSEPDSGAARGAMTAADWRQVITDAAALGVPHVRMTGGEPTTHPHWRDFVELALSLGLEVEVHSDLIRMREEWWELFARPGVTLATTYYSDYPTQHDHLTGYPGSHTLTRYHIRQALRRGIRLRAWIVDLFPGQRVRWAHTDLRSLGVERITVDRVRPVGRGPGPGAPSSSWTAPGPDETLTRYGRGRATVLPNGNLAGCVLSRDFPAGNVRRTPLAVLLGRPPEGRAALAVNVPPP
ncbi:radical SAM/SPASM domain-containing protein [Streptomyces sp. JNUCC 64]